MKKNLILCLAILAFWSCDKDRHIDGGEIIGPGTPPAGVPTAIGQPLGEPLTQSIGSGGGSISWNDGALELIFPEGALKETTPISVQHIQNTLPLGIGMSFDFGPDGTQFEKPVEIRIKYSEAQMKGTNPDLIGLAFQQENGIWQAVRNLDVDKTNKTITGRLPHFSRWSFFATAELFPEEEKLSVGEELEFEVMGYAYELELRRNPKYDGLLVPLAPPTRIQGQLVSAWMIDGKKSTAYGPKGSLQPDSNHNALAQYKAPASVPQNPVIAISTELSLGKGKFMLISYVEIINENFFELGIQRFENLEGMVTAQSGIMSLFMYQKNGEAYEAAFTFMIPAFSGVGTYEFSPVVFGFVDFSEFNKIYTSLGKTNDGELIYEGRAIITESGGYGQVISGEIEGTMYEPVPGPNTMEYVPYPFYSKFSFVNGIGD